MFDPGGQKSVLDLFDEYAPTTLIIGSYELNRQVLKAISRRPELEIVLFTPNWGSLDADLDNNVLKATDEEKRIVEGLVKSHNVRYGFTYYHKDFLEETHNCWESVGIEPASLAMGADVFDYSLGDYTEEFACDVAFVGGYWQYKGINLNKYIYPLCMDETLKVRIYGNGWCVPQCVGPIGTDKMRHLYASAKVSPCVYEPLSVEHGFDLSERIFKVISSGGFPVSQYVLALKSFFKNDEVIYADNEKDFFAYVRHFVANPDERQPYISRAIQTIYTSETYHHRALELAQRFGWIEDIIRLEPIIKQLEQVPSMRGTI
jgi:hypothetical protein